MSRLRSSGSLMWASLLLALLLGLMPMPAAIAAFKPWWLAVVLCFWLLEAPERVGLGFAFVLGLAADLIYGTLIGEHAMRLTILAFIVLRFRARLRFFTLAQQALAILVLLLNDRVVVLMIRGFSGEGLPPWTFWLAPVSGMLLWPWMFLLLDDLRLKLRQKDG